MLFMNRFEFSCFADFIVCIFKTREEHGFLENPPVGGTVNCIDETFVKLMSKNSISVLGILKEESFVKMMSKNFIIGLGIPYFLMYSSKYSHERTVSRQACKDSCTVVRYVIDKE